MLKTRSYPTFVAAALSDGGGPGGPHPPSDHRVLTNRDAADQHPMAAITGLADAVRRIPPPVEALTNLELEELLT